MKDLKLEIDPKRQGIYHELTGIYVRVEIDGKFKTVDIAELTWESVETLINEWGAAKIIKSLLSYY
jgi:hypothetical protein